MANVNIHTHSLDNLAVKVNRKGVKYLCIDTGSDEVMIFADDIDTLLAAIREASDD